MSDTGTTGSTFALLSAISLLHFCPVQLTPPVSVIGRACSAVVDRASVTCSLLVESAPPWARPREGADRNHQQRLSRRTLLGGSGTSAPGLSHRTTASSS